MTANEMEEQNVQDGGGEWLRAIQQATNCGVIDFSLQQILYFTNSK